MALSIKNPEVDSLVRAVCAVTGESLTSAIEVALRERLDRLRGEDRARLAASIHRLQTEFAHYPRQSVSEIDEWMYDDVGLPR